MIQFAQATQNDLRNIAEIHKKVYSESHFTSLFSLELLEIFYSYFINDNSSILVAKDDKNTIQGFIVCGTNIPDQIQKFKVDNRLMIWKTAVFHPVTAIKKVILQLYNKILIKHPPYEEAKYLILSIAVETPKKGIGSALLQKTEEFARSKGHKQIGLYVRVQNISALNTYLKNLYTITMYHSNQYYMQKEL